MNAPDIFALGGRQDTDPLAELTRPSGVLLKASSD